MKSIAAVALVTAVTTLASPADASFIVTYEAPGVTNSTANFAYSGVETFGNYVRDNVAGSTNFGTAGRITGTYTGVNLRAADQFGGAGGTGSYAHIGDGSSYALALSSTDVRGINYFGLWLSALDAGNSLSFFRGQQQLFTFSAADVTRLLAGKPAYNGNPGGTYRGQNTGESYAFLNFYSSDAFDKIVFSENRAYSGFESDNHTVGYATSQSGTPLGPVPEPATWAMLIAGFGIIGAGLRRRSRDAVLTA